MNDNSFSPINIPPGITGPEQDFELEHPKNILAASVQALGMDRMQRHIFICADPSIPKCCSTETSLAAWEYLKKRLKELKLDVPSETRPSSVFRTKANCLRVCTQGPILVVYPDGVWYYQVTPPVIERIINEHLIDNQVVQEYAFLIRPLSFAPEVSI